MRTQIFCDLSVREELKKNIEEKKLVLALIEGFIFIDSLAKPDESDLTNISTYNTKKNGERVMKYGYRYYPKKFPINTGWRVYVGTHASFRAMTDDDFREVIIKYYVQLIKKNYPHLFDKVIEKMKLYGINSNMIQFYWKTPQIRKNKFEILV